jgi:hypothetical protein
VEALLVDFSQKAKELREAVSPALERLQGEDGASAEGIAYLETKTHLLLRYVIQLS